MLASVRMAAGVSSSWGSFAPPIDLGTMLIIAYGCVWDGIVVTDIVSSAYESVQLYDVSIAFLKTFPAYGLSKSG